MERTYVIIENFSNIQDKVMAYLKIKNIDFIKKENKIEYNNKKLIFTRFYEKIQKEDNIYIPQNDIIYNPFIKDYFKNYKIYKSDEEFLRYIFNIKENEKYYYISYNNNIPELLSCSLETIINEIDFNENIYNGDITNEKEYKKFYKKLLLKSLEKKEEEFEYINDLSKVLKEIIEEKKEKIEYIKKL